MATRKPKHPTWIAQFAKESNRIEGIPSTLASHIDAVAEFLAIPHTPTIAQLEEYVRRVQPGAVLRERPGMDVYVGNHVPPPGGPEIKPMLETVLNLVTEKTDPYLVHQRYEQLHPFMDGNGRSGRLLWLWQMEQQGPDHKRWRYLGFLHEWYYRSLENFKA